MKIRSLCVKFVAVVLVLASFATLVACGGTSTPNTNIPGATDIGTATQPSTQAPIQTLAPTEPLTGIPVQSETQTDVQSEIPTQSTTPIESATASDIVTDVTDTESAPLPETQAPATDLPASNPADSMEPTQALTYTLSSDRKSFYVSGVGKSFKGDTIVVPATYTDASKGTLPVTRINDNAFKDNKTIKKVYLPDSIKVISTSAFQNAAALEEIHCGAELTDIGRLAFAKCKSLTTITYGDKLAKVLAEAFADCSKLKAIKLPEGVASLGEKAFAGCSSLETVVVPSTVKLFGEACFTRCSGLTKIELGSGLTSINRFTFYFCTSLAEIKYNGTAAKWKKVRADATCYMSTNIKYVICESVDETGAVKVEQVEVPRT